MNSVALVGRLARDPSVRFEGEHQTTTWTLLVEEPGRDGTTFRLYVPCIAWGKAAETAGVLSADDLVAVVGKLCWRKSALTVNVREVQPLLAAEVSV